MWVPELPDRPFLRFLRQCARYNRGGVKVRHGDVCRHRGINRADNRPQPEQAKERPQPMVAAMCAIVKRFDGTVVRTLGDGIMAFFGAPRAQEGHALLACEAALAMHAELPSPKEGPAIRIGLHLGRLVSSVPGRILLRFRRLTGSQFTSPAACKEKPSQAALALPTTAPASCSPIAMCDPSGRES